VLVGKPFHIPVVLEERNFIKQQFNKKVLSKSGGYDPGVKRFCIIWGCWGPVPKNPEFDQDGRCQKCHDRGVMPAPPQTPAPAMPPPPTPAPAEVIGQAEVAADDRDRERNNQGDRVGEIRGRDTDRGQAGNRQDRGGRRDGEIRGRDTDRGQAGNVRTGGGAEVAEDPSVGSSNRENRGGPARRRSRSSRQAHKEKLAKIVTKVQQELEDINGVVNFLLAEILEGP
jgi:hypothetical protein